MFVLLLRRQLLLNVFSFVNFRGCRYCCVQHFRNCRFSIVQGGTFDFDRQYIVLAWLSRLGASRRVSKKNRKTEFAKALFSCSVTKRLAKPFLLMFGWPLWHTINFVVIFRAPKREWTKTIEEQGTTGCRVKRTSGNYLGDFKRSKAITSWVSDLARPSSPASRARAGSGRFAQSAGPCIELCSLFGTSSAESEFTFRDAFGVIQFGFLGAL